MYNTGLAALFPAAVRALQAAEPDLVLYVAHKHRHDDVDKHFVTWSAPLLALFWLDLVASNVRANSTASGWF